MRQKHYSNITFNEDNTVNFDVLVKEVDKEEVISSGHENNVALLDIENIAESFKKIEEEDTIIFIDGESVGPGSKSQVVQEAVQSDIIKEEEVV